MFTKIRKAFAAAARAFLDGVKAALGFTGEIPEVEQETTAKICASLCFAGAAVLPLLPFPGAPVWAESLFAVGLGLWHMDQKEA